MDLRMRTSLTPEEKLARHKRVIRRFKVIVRLVVANIYWLEEIEQKELTDNVRRNIKLLTKRKKPLSPLTLKQKSILSKPIDLRTEEEKLVLRRAISGMKCFRKYPNDMKNRLAECTYFVYYPPGRDIIRQGQLGQAMYYILTGEVRIWERSFDKYLKEWIVAETGTLNAGDLFGEMALLLDILRTSTHTTTTHCELLMIKKKHFKAIIKETIIKIWNEIQNVFDTFNYFKHWNLMEKRTGVTLSKIKHFRADESILGDNVGYHDYTYFIIKGTCSIVENLTVSYFCIKGFETYILSPLYDEDARSVKLQNILKKYKDYLDSDDGLSIMSSVSGKSRFSETSSTKSKVSQKSSKSKVSQKSSKSKVSQKSSKSKVSQKSSKSLKSKRTIESDECTKYETRKTFVSIQPSGTSPISGISVKSEEPGKFMKTKDFNKHSITSSRVTAELQRSKPYKYGKPELREENHFIKICDLYLGGCFNIGEKLSRRTVIAVTPVSCLIVPRYYLMKNNKGNIWNMVQQYMTNQIPDTDKLFKKFVEQKKFKKYSKSLIRDILETRKSVTGNGLYNIPYSIRLKEGLDTDYY